MLAENQPAYALGETGFYEVWYFKLNLPEKSAALWVRLTTLADPKKSVAETWAIFTQKQGDHYRKVAAKQTLPLEAFKFTRDEIRIQQCSWEDGKTSGETGSGENRITWNLSFDIGASPFRHVPRIFELLDLNKSTVLTPNPDIRFKGTISVNGEVFAFDSAPGMQGHIFGRQSALGWAWAHCNAFDGGPPVVIEALTARIKLGGVLESPPVSAFNLDYRGERFEFNRLTDSLMTRSTYDLTHWEFQLRRGKRKFLGKIVARPEQFVGVKYEEPDGQVLYCHNSKLSDLEIMVFDGRDLKETLVASGTCAFELTAREPRPRVDFLL